MPQISVRNKFYIFYSDIKNHNHTLFDKTATYILSSTLVFTLGHVLTSGTFYRNQGNLNLQDSQQQSVTNMHSNELRPWPQFHFCPFLNNLFICLKISKKYPHKHGITSAKVFFYTVIQNMAGLCEADTKTHQKQKTRCGAEALMNICEL